MTTNDSIPSYVHQFPSTNFEHDLSYDQKMKLEQEATDLVKSLPAAHFRAAVLEALGQQERSIDTFALLIHCTKILLDNDRPWIVQFRPQRSDGTPYSRSYALGAEKRFAARVKKAAEELATEGLIVRGKTISRSVIWATPATAEKERRAADVRSQENELARAMAHWVFQNFPEEGKPYVGHNSPTLHVSGSLLQRLAAGWEAAGKP